MCPLLSISLERTGSLQRGGLCFNSQLALDGSRGRAVAFLEREIDTLVSLRFSEVPASERLEGAPSRTGEGDGAAWLHLCVGILVSTAAQFATNTT